MAKKTLADFATTADYDYALAHPDQYNAPGKPRSAYKAPANPEQTNGGTSTGCRWALGVPAFLGPPLRRRPSLGGQGWRQIAICSVRGLGVARLSLRSSAVRWRLAPPGVSLSYRRGWGHSFVRVRAVLCPGRPGGRSTGLCWLGSRPLWSDLGSRSTTRGLPALRRC
jgi:hypothetical protein